MSEESKLCTGHQTTKMMSLKVVHIALWATTLLVPTLGRIVDRCDLAHELLGLGSPRNELSTWVCIAFRESSYNTRAMGPINDYDNSTDHGLFQINNRYWCSPPGTGCGVTCESLRGDDITPQWRCAQIVFRETQVLKNNGFLAWTTYEKHCAGDTSSYIAGCGILTSDDNQRHNAGQFFGSCARTSW
uniref:lysozyme n=2 Tax=Lygus hesperus TaxID=30085 RepID=A0A146L4E8_LYGHE